jgi:hypothetical protein
MESTGIILRSEAYEPLTTKGSELTFEDLDGNFIKIYQDLYVHDQFLIEQNTAIQATGTLIDFEVRKIFNTSLIPATGNITNDLTDPKLGVIQKIYHQDSSVPTFPAGWFLMDGVYMINSLNIIYAEFSESTRVEYRIVNAATNGLRIGTTPISNGTNGRILFQSSNVVNQSSNLNYDSVNDRLGLGQTTPGARLDVRAQGALSTDLVFRIRNSANTDDLFSVNGTGGFLSTYFWSFKRLNGTTLELYSLTTGFSFREGGTPFALLGLNESKFGNTNSNDSVLVIRTSTPYGGEYPLGSILQGQGINGSVVLSPGNGVANKCMLGYYNGTSWASALEYNNTASGGTVVKLLQNGAGQFGIGTATVVASAKVQIDSTTQGLLVPRMTTTQKNAIATPAAGLQVYDTTTNKLCCFNGTSWFDLF